MMTRLDGLIEVNSLAGRPKVVRVVIIDAGINHIRMLQKMSFSVKCNTDSLPQVLRAIYIDRDLNHVSFAHFVCAPRWSVIALNDCLKSYISEVLDSLEAFGGMDVKYCKILSTGRPKDIIALFG